MDPAQQQNAVQPVQLDCMDDPAAELEQCLSLLPAEAASKLRTLLVEGEDWTVLLEDAINTLQIILVKMRKKGILPEHMAWSNIAACVWLLCSTDTDTLTWRTQCGFSHRELFWMVEQDLMGYNSGSGYARAFRRCLPCAVGKGGRCGQSNASWLCRRRLDVLDTTALQARSDKTAALNASGSTLLPSCSLGHRLCRGLDAAGQPKGPSPRARLSAPKEEENNFISLADRLTWVNDEPSEARPKTFVSQARLMMEGLAADSQRSKWVAVNRATTKRYVCLLKQLSRKDGKKHRKRSADDGAPLRLTPEFLGSSDLKWWPDYYFLIGRNEPEDCIPPELKAHSACFLNAQTCGWVAAMAPADHSHIPPWHLHTSEAIELEMRARTNFMRGHLTVVTDGSGKRARYDDIDDSGANPSPSFGGSDSSILSCHVCHTTPLQLEPEAAYLWQLSSVDMVGGTRPAFSAKISAEAAAELLQARGIRLPQPVGVRTPSCRIASFLVAISAKDAETQLSMCGYEVPKEYFGIPGPRGDALEGQPCSGTEGSESEDFDLDWSLNHLSEVDAPLCMDSASQAGSLEPGLSLAESGSLGSMHDLFCTPQCNIGHIITDTGLGASGTSVSCATNFSPHKSTRNLDNASELSGAARCGPGFVNLPEESVSQQLAAPMHGFGVPGTGSGAASHRHDPSSVTLDEQNIDSLPVLGSEFAASRSNTGGSQAGLSITDEVAIDTLSAEGQNDHHTSAVFAVLDECRFSSDGAGRDRDASTSWLDGGKAASQPVTPLEDNVDLFGCPLCGRKLDECLGCQEVFPQVTHSHTHHALGASGASAGAA